MLMSTVLRNNELNEIFVAFFKMGILVFKATLPRKYVIYKE